MKKKITKIKQENKLVSFIKFYGLLIAAIVVGFVIRIYKVENLPVILNRDEAALAYNAYLLKETGMDEWGRSWPLALESFGDYKLPGYVWSLIPVFSVFGLNDFAVRLPSVIAGTVLIYVFYLWLKELRISHNFSVLAAWLVSLLPVSIFYSRMAFEANLGLTLLVISLWLITNLSNKWNKKKFVSLLIITFFNIFTYNTPWLLLPFLAVYSWLVFPRNTQKKKNNVWLVVISLLGLFIFGAKVFLSLTAQKSGITIFTDETVWSNWIAYREQLSPAWLWFFGSKYVYWLGLIWENIWQSFSFKFLVTSGGTHPWHNLPHWGHLNILIYILGWVGLGFTFKQVWAVGVKKILKFNKLSDEIRFNLATLFLFFSSLIPSVITVDSPHATRSLLFIIFWVYWAVRALEFLYKQAFWPTKEFFWILIASVIFIESFFYNYQLFVKYPNNQGMFNPGFDSMIQFIDERSQETKVAIVDPTGYEYILLAWYLKVPANEYLDNNVRQLPDKIGFSYGERVGRFHFIANPNDKAADEEVLLMQAANGKGWQILGLTL
ncbi:MAG: hypothetical protein AUK08_01610 [Candidatus Pacebacteria bacterium CG2_30_36_39]|nr:hypothetical protein [Candidatus Pacearchaeota archaeon]OIP74463.1 MAG: hypothetical protein AUK08_01610 [Candidatus Pacebacteria bacterium CG2_30_36_39]